MRQPKHALLPGTLVNRDCTEILNKYQYAVKGGLRRDFKSHIYALIEKIDFFFFFAVLEIETRAPCILAKDSTTEMYFYSPF